MRISYMQIMNNLMQTGLTVSLAALVPLLLRRVLKKRYPARAVCLVWALLALRLLVPVQLTLPEAPVQVTPRTNYVMQDDRMLLRAGRSAGRADAGPMGNGRTGGRAQPCRHKPDNNLQPDRSPARSVARRRRHFRHPAGCQLRNAEKAAGPHGSTGGTRRPARCSGLSAQRSRYFPENSASDLPCRRLPDARGFYPPGTLSAGREHFGRRLPPSFSAVS